MSDHPLQAGSILREAAATIDGRAAQRDTPQERSMARCVDAFNGLTKHNLTEEQGWMFMAILKMARAQNGGKFVKDDYVDGAAYIALAGESAGGEFDILDYTNEEIAAYIRASDLEMSQI
jgi:Domain of unknown function (DUF6378)